MQSRLVCYCVGCDDVIEAAVQGMAQRWGFEFACHGNLTAFQDAADFAKTGCVIAQTSDPIGVLNTIETAQSPLTTLFLTSVPDTRLTVAAIRHGAEDVLEWPADADYLASSIERACATSLQKQQRLAETAAAQKRLSQLTDGEREVLQLMLSGKLNKSIASRLGIALRTVEARRKRVFTKLGTRSLGEIANVLQTTGMLAATGLLMVN